MRFLPACALLALVVFVGLHPLNVDTALAFHEQGVAACSGCHTMHNSQDGLLVDPDAPNGNAYLLIDGTPSDVCLHCHSSAFGTDPLAPPDEIGAGNFVYLLEDNLNDAFGGATAPIPGDAAGHNVVAPSRGSSADGTLTTAPGGTFPSSVLGCTSCHDPHGNADFRMLNGVGTVQAGLYTFTSPAPAGVGLSIFSGAESQSNHSAYHSGMSDWCGNCHRNMHTGAGRFVHPAQRALGAHVASAYNLYNGSSDPLGGVVATAYITQVPFETPGMTTTSTTGPAASNRVMCLSCHRAHATSAPDAGRWDFNVTYLADDGVESGSYPLPDPYNDPAQRSLCNKCHGKDAFSAAP